MGVRPKPATVRRSAQARSAKPPAGRGRKAAIAPAAWEQAAEFTGEREQEIDCERIVERDARNLRRYYDEFN